MALGGEGALDGGLYFDTFQQYPPGYRSTNPIIAYDGELLWISVDEIHNSGERLDHHYFVVDPDSGEIQGLGELLGLANNRLLSGMVEIDGTLYALDTAEIVILGLPDLENTDLLLSWDKEDEFGDPIPNPGAVSVPLLAPQGQFDDVDGDLGTDGTYLFVDCFAEGFSVGICKFETNGEFVEIIPNHVSNPNLIPGPRLGGLDIVYDADRDLEVLIGADRNGLIVEMADLADGSSLGGYETPHEFQIIRASIR